MPMGVWRTELEEEWGSRLWSRALRITRNIPGKGRRGRSVCKSGGVYWGVTSSFV